MGAMTQSQDERRKNEHVIGRYVVRTEWRGSTLLYDVFRSGMFVACGFDSLSPDEETALRGIIDRLFGKEQRNAA